MPMFQFFDLDAGGLEFNEAVSTSRLVYILPHEADGTTSPFWELGAVSSKENYGLALPRVSRAATRFSAYFVFIIGNDTAIEFDRTVFSFYPKNESVVQRKGNWVSSVRLSFEPAAVLSCPWKFALSIG
ncbi:uncharacterized protein EI97DRAFT_440163 [Westerdykella ornata]|uniref:Uncharacterized protein n=1 Tax=Westerdykella ornata TaxID=318751 RepID=A0A6A6JQ00_WESOR|nr:uncharacterized protein EI97DRAFT_440163 [Westerdykella ornata]KAF2278612.1 hypothetical protein EI97DRAFT_440163 [Westerdykella ornata]